MIGSTYGNACLVRFASALSERKRRKKIAQSPAAECGASRWERICCLLTDRTESKPPNDGRFGLRASAQTRNSSTCVSGCFLGSRNKLLHSLLQQHARYR
ncbi:hypothetical protein IF1G_08136 [Cordyceps javanica]|uniref:Uncharacterized protein n=1 Tax=Cordyceps javanica TaxID=43265 RepID=A0A545UVR8_9HYPO|nr:hypothetical protein IF1G_08136 [Cordyceps javanica]